MRVNTIYPAVQGEGVNAGIPMVIVRLQGCSIHCPWCDTKETWSSQGGKEMTVDEIVTEVQGKADGHRWVMLTGGEPAEQDIKPLVGALRDIGFQVALETSGTQLVSDCDWLCVSPKHIPPLAEVLATANEVKWVVGKESDIPSEPGPNPCLQPMSLDRKATELCLKVVQERGWRLSVQIHKLLGIS